MAKRITTKGGTTRPSIGRPRTDAVRDHWISFRVTAAEHYLLLDKARRSALTPGEFARSRALRGMARARKTRNETPQLFGDATRDIYHEVRRQGVLLNQIAHHCNTHKIPPPSEVRHLANTLLALWQKLLAS